MKEKQQGLFLEGCVYVKAQKVRENEGFIWGFLM
jgi:hypothetical protein